MNVNGQWTTERLGELRSKDKYAFVGGPFGSSLVSSDYTEDGVPVIRGCNLPANSSFALDELVFVSEKKADSLRQNTAIPGDLVFTQRGTLGQVGLIPKKSPYSRFIVSQSQMKLTVDPEKADPRYLYYYFRLPSTVEMINSLAISSGVPHINLDILRKFQVLTPPVPVQNKIAAILSAFDELIENNKRRIMLLEKLAGEIYREWFVRLRFPDHEKVKRLKGVPKGWEVRELKEVAAEVGKSTRPGSHLSQRFYLPLDLLAPKQMLPVGHAEYTEAQSSLVTFEKGDFLFGAMRPYQHKVAIAPFPGITRTTCFVIRPKTEHSWTWLFLTLFQTSTVDYATLICNGSDRPYTVWNKGMERMKILWPNKELLKKFETLSRPMLDSVVSMYFVQQKLKACRDLLLPRLISGKLSVENLDIQFPPGMAEELNDAPAARSHA